MHLDCLVDHSNCFLNLVVNRLVSLELLNLQIHPHHYLRIVKSCLNCKNEGGVDLVCLKVFFVNVENKTDASTKLKIKQLLHQDIQYINSGDRQTRGQHLIHKTLILFIYLFFYITLCS